MREHVASVCDHFDMYMHTCRHVSQRGCFVTNDFCKRCLLRSGADHAVIVPVTVLTQVPTKCSHLGSARTCCTSLHICRLHRKDCVPTAAELSRWSGQAVQPLCCEQCPDIKPIGGDS